MSQTLFAKKLDKILAKIDDLKDSSKLTYKKFLLKLFKIVKPSTVTFKFLKDVDNIRSIVDKETDSTAKMIYISIYRVLEKAPGMKAKAKVYKQLSFDISKRLNDKAADNVINEKRSGRLKQLKDLKKVTTQLLRNYISNPSELKKNYYLVGLMYIMNPFTPRLEYADMKIIKNSTDDNGKDNFLLINSSMKVILNDYKTFGKYGKQIITLPQNIRTTLIKLDIPNQQFLFQKGSSGYKKKTFSQFIKNAMKSVDEDLGLNEIRIIKESHLQSQASYKKLSEKQKNQKHIKLFLHSIGIARTAYRKLELIE